MKESPKIITSLLVSALLFQTISYAKNLSTSEVVKRIQQQKSGNNTAVSQRVNLDDTDVSRNKLDDYRDAVIANYYIQYEKNKTMTKPGAKIIVLSDNVREWEKEQEKLRKEKMLSNEKDNAEKRDDSFYTRGYCSFLNTIDVSEMVSFAEVECVLDGIGYARMSINIYPEHSAKALVAKAVDIIPDGIEQKDRLHVKQGVILNGLRTGLNIASIVNDRKIEKMMAAGMLSANNIVSEESLKYMDALEASRQQENSQVVPGTGGSAPIVIQNKSTQAPNMSDSITIAGIRMASSLVGIIGESMINNLPYLYRIERGQRIYFDGLVTAKRPQPEKGLIEFNNNKVVHKSMQDITVDSKGIVTYKKTNKAKDDSDDLSIEERSLGEEDGTVGKTRMKRR